MNSDMDIMIALAAFIPGTAVPSASSQAKAVIRIERPAIVTKEAWEAREKQRRKEVRRIDPSGHIIVIRLIEYE